jgi:large subunit ribosomal protein L3
MAGRMGTDHVTVKKLTVFRADAARNVLLIKGALPGSVNSMVVVRKAK